MKIHPRERRCVKAQCEIELAIVEIVQRHKLTEAECLRVVNAAGSMWIGGVAKYAIREERHGDTDKPGGLE